MKKILFISKYLSTSQNGFETRLACLIKYFKKYNYDVLAITSSFSLKKEKFKNQFTKKKLDGVNYIFIKENNNYSLYSFQRIFSWINFEINLLKLNFNKLGFVPDIIYVSSLSLLTIINGIILKKKFNTKLVFEMRDLWPYLLYTTGKFSKYNPLIILLGYIEKIGIYYSDLVVGLVPRIKNYLQYREFPNKKFLFSSFPVNKRFFLKKKIDLNIDNTFFNICYAGNFGFDNHLQALFDMIPEINDKKIKFHFFGTGSLKEDFKRKYNLSKNINFYEPVSYKNMHSVLVQMDCLILSFGFNNKYPLFGYELNKINNYIMSQKPIIVLGSKKNLSRKRGEFIFVSKNSSLILKKKINLIINNYNHFLKIAKTNKLNLLKNNNENRICEEIILELKKL
jgi:hypothetical protein